MAVVGPVVAYCELTELIPPLFVLLPSADSNAFIFDITFDPGAEFSSVLDKCLCFLLSDKFFTLL